ncbi:hypothetical protein [Aureitalea marina]|uniref:hypothetical protein n=1 Tax=Aureitalea marina TaxID=930804 RepID=UPI00248272DD|nr:hypothetical protein [Aureitalea marina]
MILEVYISMKLKCFPNAAAMEIIEYLSSHYPMRPFNLDEQALITEYMKHDKKNRNGQINFVLLSNFGEIALDQQVPQELLSQAFEYYNSNLT